ncbi:MAG: penicillin-binding protein activator [Candidatus Bathyarchaeia archaeon]|jgi:branched-chain amino acid transport system substrate-binding protein
MSETKKKPMGMAIGTFVIGLLIGLVVMYGAAPSLGLAPSSSTMVTTTVQQGMSGTITIGGLLGLTGSLSSYGQREKVAMDMAISDINGYLSASGSSVQFQSRVEDTGNDPATALQKLQTLAAQGIQVYVGPLSSGEASNILAYANTNHLVLISQSSTAEKLAIPNDFLFRLIPTDFAQSKAVARVVYQYGIQDVVVVARHDAWGDGLSAAFEARYQQLGGTVIDTVSYTPTTGTQDFSPQLTQMKSDYDAAVTKYGASKVGVVAVEFNEFSVMLQQASGSYKSLLGTVWFGTDGIAGDTTVSGAASGPVAAQVKCLSTIYAPTRGEKYAAFTSAFIAKFGGQPDPYSYTAYDATWVAALSIISVGKNDGAAVQKVLINVANNYYGVAGWPDLNSNGDRTISDYDIFEVTTVNATAAQWNTIGSWSASSDGVSYSQTP